MWREFFLNGSIVRASGDHTHGKGICRYLNGLVGQKWPSVRIWIHIWDWGLSEKLTEEPYVWEIRLSGSVEGLGNNRSQELRKAPVYSTKGGISRAWNSLGYQDNTLSEFSCGLLSLDASYVDSYTKLKSDVLFLIYYFRVIVTVTITKWFT